MTSRPVICKVNVKKNIKRRLKCTSADVLIVDIPGLIAIRETGTFSSMPVRDVEATKLNILWTP
jgi:hypothetical protein